MKKNTVLRLIRLNFFKLLGAGTGLVLAILLLTLGFWRTLLIAAFVGVGIWGGTWLDRGRYLSDLVEHIIPADKRDADEDI